MFVDISGNSELLRVFTIVPAALNEYSYDVEFVGTLITFSTGFESQTTLL